jgi:hypothetical protein
VADVKVLVTGSRDLVTIGAVRDRISALSLDDVLIHGGARGADTLAAVCARERGMWVVEVACGGTHWRRFGRRAGHLRNVVMLDLDPDLVIAFWDGSSPGTRGMMAAATLRGIPVEVIEI